jgi:type IV secretory pathway VirD2 relaxase
MMVKKIKTDALLSQFLTNNLLENDVGVIINKDMPQDSFVAISIDEYYHHIGLKTIPAIADILLVAQKLSQRDQHHIYIVEMKNISSPHSFTVKNIYDKFYTAVEDFMKIKHADIFMNNNYKIERFKLYFVSDAYRLRRKGMTDEQINSFLLETKIMLLQSMQSFQFRNFVAVIEYKLPNPLLEWY